MAQKRREKAAREHRDITQIDVAKAAQVSKGSVSRYESDTDKPRDPVLERIAAYLDTTPEFLRYGAVVQRGPERPSPQQLADFVTKEKAAADREREQAHRPAAKKAGGGARGRGRRR